MLSHVYEMDSEETPTDVEGCLLLLVCDDSHEADIVKEFLLSKVLAIREFFEFGFAVVYQDHACVPQVAPVNYPALLRFESGYLRDKAYGMDESLDLYAEFADELEARLF